GRGPVFVALGFLGGGIGDDLLEEQMHEEEQRLRLHDEEDRLVVGIVVEMLMNAAILDDHHIARLPVDAAPIMHVVAIAFQHIEHGAVHMPVLLPEGAWPIGLDMRFDRLRHHRVLRIDDLLAVKPRPTLPGQVARGIDAGLLQELLVEMAVSAGELAHENALAVPALPDHRFLFVGLVVARAGRLAVVKVCRHHAPSLARRMAGSRERIENAPRTDNRSGQNRWARRQQKSMSRGAFAAIVGGGGPAMPKLTPRPFFSAVDGFKSGKDTPSAFLERCLATSTSWSRKSWLSSIPTRSAPARTRPPRPRAGARASRSRRSTACRSGSRTSSRPRICRPRWARRFTRATARTATRLRSRRCARLVR